MRSSCLYVLCLASLGLASGAGSVAAAAPTRVQWAPTPTIMDDDEDFWRNFEALLPTIRQMLNLYEIRPTTEFIPIVSVGDADQFVADYQAHGLLPEMPALQVALGLDAVKGMVNLLDAHPGILPLASETAFRAALADITTKLTDPA